MRGAPLRRERAAAAHSFTGGWSATGTRAQSLPRRRRPRLSLGCLVWNSACPVRCGGRGGERREWTPRAGAPPAPPPPIAPQPPTERIERTERRAARRALIWGSHLGPRSGGRCAVSQRASALPRRVPPPIPPPYRPTDRRFRHRVLPSTCTYPQHAAQPPERRAAVSRGEGAFLVWRGLSASAGATGASRRTPRGHGDRGRT